MSAQLVPSDVTFVHFSWLRWQVIMVSHFVTLHSSFEELSSDSLYNGLIGLIFLKIAWKPDCHLLLIHVGFYFFVTALCMNKMFQLASSLVYISCYNSRESNLTLSQPVQSGGQKSSYRPGVKMYVLNLANKHRLQQVMKTIVCIRLRHLYSWSFSAHFFHMQFWSFWGRDTIPETRGTLPFDLPSYKQLCCDFEFDQILTVLGGI